jgi:hypothetical protein
MSARLQTMKMAALVISATALTALTLVSREGANERECNLSQSGLVAG